MGAGDASFPESLRGLSRVGGVGLMAYALLSFGREVLDLGVRPLPSTGADFVSWTVANDWTLGVQNEVLFAALMCLIPAVPALYDRLQPSSPASATLGCGTLAAVIPVLAMLDIVHGRLVFPVYGLRVGTPSVAEFAVAIYYGGLHAAQLMLGFAVLMLALAMRRAGIGGPLTRTGPLAAAAAAVTGYPWLIGTSASLALHAGVAAWWGATGWMLYRHRNALSHGGGRHEH